MLQKNKVHAIWLLLAIVLGLVGFGGMALARSGCSQTNANVVDASTQGPHLEYLDKTYFDFDVVEEDEKIQHEFRIKNTGSKDLIIKNSKTGCGCTGIEVFPKIIPPGGEAKVVINYIGRRVTGREVLKAWITTNEPEQAQHEFTISGRVRFKVFWYPESVSFFVKKGMLGLPKDVTLLTREEVGKIENISTSSDYIQTSSHHINNKTICRISLSPSCPQGNRTEKVTVKMIIGDIQKSIDIPVYIMKH